MADPSHSPEAHPWVLGYSTLKPDRKRLHRLLIFGACLVTTFALLVPILSPVLIRRNREPSLRVLCASNMRQISLGAIMYANEHGGRFPDDLDTIFQEEDVLPRVFVCPATDADLPSAPTTQAVYSTLKQAGALSYIYVGKGLTTKAADDVVLLYEPLSDHENDGMNVCFADGHVEWLTASEAQSILQQAAAGVRPIRFPQVAATSRPTTSSPP